MDSRDIAISPETGPFEEIKRTNEHGAEYWAARELMPLLGYEKWNNFKNAVKKASISCERSGNEPEYHFADVGKMVPTGSGAERSVSDMHLSRFACYLIAQNGDPNKSQIAGAQRYFAIQTRRQELSDAAAKAKERLDVRDQCSTEFKALSGAAKQAGVQNHMFGIFHDAGYKGMYGGLGRDAIKKKKGVRAKEALFDRMGTTELAANVFRLTQARDKLNRENVSSEKRAIDIHHEVGNEVRQTIKNIGGTMPEDLQPVEHIRQAKKIVKKSTPILELDDKDAKGLVGDEDVTVDDL